MLYEKNAPESIRFFSVKYRNHFDEEKKKRTQACIFGVERGSFSEAQVGVLFSYQIFLHTFHIGDSLKTFLKTPRDVFDSRLYTFTYKTAKYIY